jgi:hypothetical protein
VHCEGFVALLILAYCLDGFSCVSR